MLRRQDEDYFRGVLTPAEFNHAVSLARTYGEPIYKVLKEVARSVTTVGKTKSRFQATLEASTSQVGSKRDIEGNIKPKKLNFDNETVAIMGDDITFTRSKANVGRPKKRTAAGLFKAQIGSMYETIYRYQRVSANLLGPGITSLAYGKNTLLPDASEKTYGLPFHFMSLTQNDAFNENFAIGARKQGLCKAIYRNPKDSAPFEDFQGNVGYCRLATQNHEGIWQATSNFQREVGTSHSAFDRVFHKYTDIRLNLYGSLYYPLTYKVMVVTGMPTEMNFSEFDPCTDDIEDAPASVDFPIDRDSALGQMIIDGVRPLVTNPIVGSSTDHNWKGKFRYLYNKSFKVPCLSYGNGAAQAGSTIDSTNVRNVNMFLRHDRFRNYQWYTNEGINTENDNIAGVGYTILNDVAASVVENVCEVDREERVYLIITCTCPKEVNGPAETIDAATVTGELPQTAAMPYSGSYDIVVRNCFRYGDGEPNK